MRPYSGFGPQVHGAPATTRLVLEETASADDGGCVGFSDRFISGFSFLHTVGIVGEAGWQQAPPQSARSPPGSPPLRPPLSA